MNLVERLGQLGLFVASAESLTGGLISSKLIETPGSSKVVLGGIVAYQDQVKKKVLGIPAELLASFGAVDSRVAVLMASSARLQFADANLTSSELVVGVSSTGVAGPDSASGQTVGTVFIGISSARAELAIRFNFEGDRDQIRNMATESALIALGEHLDEFWG